MGKAIKLIIMISGLVLIFHMTGLIEPGTTINSSLLQLLLDPQEFSVSQLWTGTFNLLALAAIAGAVIVGIVTKQIEPVAMAGIIIPLSLLFIDFLAVFNAILAESVFFAIILMGPVFISFLYILVDYWRGHD